MADNKSISENCCYSFRVLFRAVENREWTSDEEQHFIRLSQPEKNATVKGMVARTEGTWQCEDRLWSDGQIYTAFWKRE